MLKSIFTPLPSSLRFFAAKKTISCIEKTSDEFSFACSKFINFDGKIPELDTTQLDSTAAKIIGFLESEHKKINIGRASPSIYLMESFVFYYCY